MSLRKSEKELAFIQDLYVATDWGERFATLIDENIELPKKGTVLYLGSATGTHALSILEKSPKELNLVCVDENQQCLEIAKSKANVLKVSPEFQRQQFDSLSFDDDSFDLVLADTSLVSPTRLPEILAEMVRVTAPGGTTALTAATAASFGEFFSILWEAIMAAEIEGHDLDAESLITELPRVSDLEDIARENGLEEVASWTSNEEFVFPSGKDFLEAPVVADFLMTEWLSNFEDEAERQRLLEQIQWIVDTERGGLDFILSVKATVLSGRK